MGHVVSLFAYNAFFFFFPHQFWNSKRINGPDLHTVQLSQNIDNVFIFKQYLYFFNKICGLSRTNTHSIVSFLLSLSHSLVCERHCNFRLCVYESIYLAQPLKSVPLVLPLLVGLKDRFSLYPSLITLKSIHFVYI